MSTEKAGLVVVVRDCVDAIGRKSSASLSAGAAAKESANPRHYAAQGVRELPAEQSQDRDDAEHQDAHGKGSIPIEMARRGAVQHADDAAAAYLDEDDHVMAITVSSTSQLSHKSVSRCTNG